MVLANWSKISGADLKLVKKACHLDYGAVSDGSESRYVHNGTGNVFYVSQGVSTWFALIKPSSGTAKFRVGGIFKYYDSDNYVIAYLEIEVNDAGSIVSAKVIYKKREGGSETVVLEDDVMDGIQHLAGMIVGADVDVDDFEDGSLEGWEGDVSVVDGGYEGTKSLQVRASSFDGSDSRHGYKSVGCPVAAEVLAKKSGGCDGYYDECNISVKIEGATPPDDWGWMFFTYLDDTMDINCECGCIPVPPGGCSCEAKALVDTIKYYRYTSAPWAFIKFYGWLKQVGGKWYLDIEVRVSNDYYSSPDTSVEPSTSVISSCLVEIPSAIVGNNTKCGIILGRGVSDWRSQGYPNIVIDYTKLFY